MAETNFPSDMYKNQLDVIFRELPIPTFTWQMVEDDLILLNYNNAAEQITEGGVKKFLGIKASVMYQAQKEILDDLMQCAKEQTTFSREMRYTYQTSGKEKDLHVTYGFISPHFVIVHTEDITERIQVEQKLLKRNIEINILNQIIKLGNSAADLEVFLGNVLDSTISLMHFDGGGYYLLDPATGHANLMYHKGLPQLFVDLVKTVSIEEEPYRSVFIDNMPLFIKNYSESSPKWVKEWGIVSVASIPLIAKGKTVGALNIASQKEHGFSVEERELLISIGREVGATLKRLQIDELLREAFNRVTFYKDLFIHDISNLINNLNLALLQYSEFPDNSTKVNKLKESHEVMRTHINRSMKLISNVRKLSQIEDSEIPLSRFDLFEKLEEAKKIIGVHYLEKDVRIQIESEYKKGFIQANELLIDVFENLLINAIKYNDNSIVKIEISVSRLEENGKSYFKLEFKDNGIGIKDSNKKVIFQKGHKDEKLTKGMGFGLTLVIKILEIYEGKIWVEDKVFGNHSKGSNFIVLIPEYSP
jgi:signal transduction histidine kinase